MDTQIATPTVARPTLEIDLIADLACPWSFLGKRSLERALDNLYGLPVRALRWHGFRTQMELALTHGDTRRTWRDHLASRLPPNVTVDFAQKSLTEAGESVGIHFDFDRIERLPDTTEAHRLVVLAAREDKHSEVADGLFRAFFEQGRDIGDPKVIEAVGRENHLAEETLIAFANPAEGRDIVEADEKRLRGFGVTVTPNLLINGRVLVPGPADVSTYVQALDQALFPQLTGPSSKKRLH
ncbi:MAG TPA: DsbA family oxidoreductase [Steroidobacteraceae bacterium]|jgi:predicted DsbA family dithiol-disulfide isomerase|nr:DsbA family oxidoreductase [Steroidobacteraceae bacterium]